MDASSQICQENVEKLRSCAILRELLQIITTTILSLFLPLAFLLVARLKTAYHLLSVSAYPTSLILYINGSLHYVFVCFVTAAAFVHCLIGTLKQLSVQWGLKSWFELKISNCNKPLLDHSTQLSDVRSKQSSGLIKPVSRPCLDAAWIFIFAFLVCVCLAIEMSIAGGVDDASGLSQKRSGLISRAVFFLGLHEIMLYWSKTFAKPIVDETIFGFARKGRWIDKVVMALGFGTLWWWRLRGETESLVNTVVDPSVADRGLYYLTATIGIVRVIKGLFWVGKILLCCRRVEGNNGHSNDGDDKV